MAAFKTARQGKPIPIVNRNNEAGLASEIETMEMVSLRLEDHGAKARCHSAARYSRRSFQRSAKDRRQ